MQCNALEVIVAFDTNCWRDRRVYWLKRHPISTCVEARVQTFAECNRHLWCISVRGSDWIKPRVQRVEMILLLLDPRLAAVVERAREPAMWWRYNGVPHRSAANYWPLSGLSMFPSHPPQHPPLISSPSGRGFPGGRVEFSCSHCRNRSRNRSLVRSASALFSQPLLPSSFLLICRRRRSGVSVNNHKCSV